MRIGGVFFLTGSPWLPKERINTGLEFNCSHFRSINRFGTTIFRNIWILWTMSAFPDSAEPDWNSGILIHLHACFPVWRSMRRWSGGGVARCSCRRRSRCSASRLWLALFRVLSSVGVNINSSSFSVAGANAWASPRLFQDNLRSGL